MSVRSIAIVLLWLNWAEDVCSRQSLIDVLLKAHLVVLDRPRDMKTSPFFRGALRAILSSLFLLGLARTCLGFGRLARNRQPVTDPPPEPPHSGSAKVPKPTFIGRFEQPLDHFNLQDTRTWGDRYFVYNASYRPGGPLFFYAGNEGALESFYYNTGLPYTVETCHRPPLLYWGELEEICW